MCERAGHALLSSLQPSFRTNPFLWDYVNLDFKASYKVYVSAASIWGTKASHIFSKTTQIRAIIGCHLVKSKVPFPSDESL